MLCHGFRRPEGLEVRPTHGDGGHAPSHPEPSEPRRKLIGVRGRQDQDGLPDSYDARAVDESCFSAGLTYRPRDPRAAEDDQAHLDRRGPGGSRGVVGQEDAVREMGSCEGHAYQYAYGHIIALSLEGAKLLPRRG